MHLHSGSCVCRLLSKFRYPLNARMHCTQMPAAKKKKGGARRPPALQRIEDEDDEDTVPLTPAAATGSSKRKPSEAAGGGQKKRKTRNSSQTAADIAPALHHPSEGGKEPKHVYGPGHQHATLDEAIAHRQEQ